MSGSRPEVVRGLLGNSIALLAATQITAVLGYAFWMLCARWASPSVIGIASTVISTMTLVAIAAVAGFIPMLPRLLPGADSDERSGLCSAALAVTCVASGLAGVIAALVLPERLQVAVGTGWLVALLSSGAIGTAMLLVLNAALLGVRRAELSLLGSVVASLSRLIAIVAIVTLGVVAAEIETNAIHTILLVWVASLMISSALSLGLLARATPGFRIDLDRIWFSRVRRSMGWDHAATLALRAPALAIPILASSHLDAADVGYLVMAILIASAFLAVPGAVSNALLADCADDPARLHAQARKALRLIGILLIPPVILTCLLAREVLSLFGDGYASYSTVLILLLVSTFPDALINVALAVLRVMRRLALVAVVTVVGAVITIGGTWLSLPYLGVYGAVVAMLGSQLIAILLLIAVMRCNGAFVEPRRVPTEHDTAQDGSFTHRAQAGQR